jgi:sterol desaturase/sphingolipid hydroxylase (fatty acid hydroxylase superfamily)
MPILAFYNHPVDELLLYLVPLVSTTRLIHMVYPLSAFELALLVTYKVYIEITGHISYSSKRKCSFPQCIWLPRSLGIELYSDDHATHHAYSNCNFGKRFTLWDRVFETYRSQNIST